MKKLPLLISLVLHCCLAGILYWQTTHPISALAGGGLVEVSLVRSRGEEIYPHKQTITKSTPAILQTQKTSKRQIIPKRKTKPGKNAGDYSGAGSGPKGNNLLLAKILSQIEKNKQYPRQAKNVGIQGDVSLAFKITPAGNIAELNIVKSSQINLLDQAAIDTINRGAPYPYYEKPLSITIRFKIDDN